MALTISAYLAALSCLLVGKRGIKRGVDAAVPQHIVVPDTLDRDDNIRVEDMPVHVNGAAVFVSTQVTQFTTSGIMVRRQLDAVAIFRGYRCARVIRRVMLL